MQIYWQSYCSARKFMNRPAKATSQLLQMTRKLVVAGAFVWFAGIDPVPLVLYRKCPC
jgi:hypothetical protein